jgi:hypothetical protein
MAKRISLTTPPLSGLGASVHTVQMLNRFLRSIRPEYPYQKSLSPAGALLTAFFQDWISRNSIQTLPALQAGFPNNEFLEVMATDSWSRLMFEQTLGLAFHGIALPDPAATTALVVACGNGQELPIIRKRLAKQIYAFDYAPVASAQKATEAISSIHVARFDGTDKYPALFDRQYDFAIFRHPEVLCSYNTSDECAAAQRIPNVWQSVLLNAMLHVRENGLLIFTTYFEPEATKIKQFLEAIGLEVVLQVNDTYSIPMPRNAFLDALKSTSQFSSHVKVGPKMGDQKRDHFVLRAHMKQDRLSAYLNIFEFCPQTTKSEYGEIFSYLNNLSREQQQCAKMAARLLIAACKFDRAEHFGLAYFDGPYNLPELYKLYPQEAAVANFSRIAVQFITNCLKNQCLDPLTIFFAPAAIPNDAPVAYKEVMAQLQKEAQQGVGAAFLPPQ